MPPRDPGWRSQGRLTDPNLPKLELNAIKTTAKSVKTFRVCSETKMCRYAGRVRAQISTHPGSTAHLVCLKSTLSGRLVGILTTAEVFVPKMWVKSTQFNETNARYCNKSSSGGGGFHPKQIPTNN